MNSEDSEGFCPMTEQEEGAVMCKLWEAPTDKIQKVVHKDRERISAFSHILGKYDCVCRE